MPPQWQCLCSLEWARAVWPAGCEQGPPDHKLGSLCMWLGLEMPVQLHRAEPDVRLAAQLNMRLARVAAQHDDVNQVGPMHTCVCMQGAVDVSSPVPLRM